MIYYASKTLNEAQRNYTTTEKELLAVVYALDKFYAYFVGSEIIIFKDHSALKYFSLRKMPRLGLLNGFSYFKNLTYRSRIKRGWRML